MKNNLCLFERPFIQKSGVFLFEISFFVLEILNSVSIFPEIFSILPLHSFQQCNFITELICIIENVNISKTKNDILKRKTAFFCILKGPSHKHYYTL